MSVHYPSLLHENKERRVSQSSSSFSPYPVQHRERRYSPERSFKNLEAKIAQIAKFPLADKFISREICERFKSIDFHNAISLLKKEYRVVDAYIYNALLKKTGELWDAAKMLYKYIPETCKNAHNINLFISLAAKNKKLETATEAFKEAQKRGIDDAYTYDAIFNAAGNCGDKQLVKQLWKAASSKNRTDRFDAVAFNAAITAARAKKTLKTALAIFEKAREHRKVDAYTYSNGICIAGDRKNRQLVEEAFNEALSKKCVDTAVLNATIKAAGDTQNLPFALLIYRLAKYLGKADSTTYNIVIDITGENGDFERTQRVFKKAKKLIIADPSHADPRAFSNFIKAAGNNRRLLLAQEALDEAVFYGLDDGHTRNVFIIAAGNNGNVPLAHEAFKEAKPRKDVFINNWFIHVAGENGYLLWAKEAFDETKELKIDNEFTHNIIINAAVKNGDLELAESLFAAAKKFRNIVTFNTMIDARGKNGNFAGARELFEETKKLGIANAITYNIYIDILINLHKIQLAIDAFNESGLQYHFDCKNGRWVLNLHFNLSHGAGIAVLYNLCKTHSRPVPPFVCICGQGSEKDGNYLAFRDALIDHIKKYFPSTSCKLDPTNEGCLLISNLTSP